MQRLIAVIAAVAVIGAAVRVTRLHTHAYRDHAHAEHQHGPAVHQHQAAAQEERGDETTAHIAPCDAGRHVVSLTVGCAPASDSSRGCAEVNLITVSGRPAISRFSSFVIDVRAHGPPPSALDPSRAPPRYLPA